VVLVARRPTEPTTPTPPRVVVGVDASPSCASAIGFAFHAAARREIPLVAVHTLTSDALSASGGTSATPGRAEVDARAVLDEALGRWRDQFPGTPVHVRVSRAAPAPALLAASWGAALVVLGCRGRGLVRSRFCGSVGRDVARHALSPLAIVGARSIRRPTAPDGDAPRHGLRRPGSRTGPWADRRAPWDWPANS
jgi:nucleotide-binding universal stress UspA family protein